MEVLLVIDRPNTGIGISAMVWTAGDDDPRLLESKKFKGEAAFKVWLGGIATRYGRSNITVKWTDSLNADERLARVLDETVGSRPEGTSS
jgi:hypothetical protein